MVKAITLEVMDGIALNNIRAYFRDRKVRTIGPLISITHDDRGQITGDLEVVYTPKYEIDDHLLIRVGINPRYMKDSLNSIHNRVIGVTSKKGGEELRRKVIYVTREYIQEMYPQSKVVDNLDRKLK